jgi:hypothetical protein
MSNTLVLRTFAFVGYFVGNVFNDLNLGGMSVIHRNGNFLVFSMDHHMSHILTTLLNLRIVRGLASLIA